jgi:hypothetical protein
MLEDEGAPTRNGKNAFIKKIEHLSSEKLGSLLTLQEEVEIKDRDPKL